MNREWIRISRRDRRAMRGDTGEGHAPLTWGQASQLLSHVDAATGGAALIWTELQAPQAPRVETLARIETLIAAVPALRTRVHPDSGQQTCLGHVEYDVLCVESLAEWVDLPVEVPIEALPTTPPMVVVAESGTTVLMGVPHVVMDAGSRPFLQDTFLSGQYMGLAPSDLAKEQTRFKDSGTCQRAIDHAVSVARAHNSGATGPIPGTAFRSSVRGFGWGAYIQEAARMLGVRPATVVAGATALAIERALGHVVGALSVDVANRRGPRSGMIDCLVQPSFVKMPPRLDTAADWKLLELARLVAVANAYYDAFELREALSRQQLDIPRVFVGDQLDWPLPIDDDGK